MSKLEEISQQSITDEVKANNSKYNLNKFDYDLFKDEYNIIQKVIRIKKINISSKQCKWKVMDDNKTIFIIESAKLNKREKEFLQTLDGFNFMLKAAKNNIDNFNKFKIILKKILPAQPRKIIKKSKKKVLTRKK